MAISDKNRKRLWAKSGNRCAISKIELVIAPNSECDDSIIGEECHINAQNPGGARYLENISNSDIDNYDNFILLSRNYHKIIDDNPKYYTKEKLQNIKMSHEKWVRETLDFEIRNIKSKKFPDHTISFLTRITTGSQLLNVIECHAYDFDNDELINEYEVDLVSAFFQNAQDWGDLHMDLDSGERVRAKHNLSKELQELEDNDFWVFGGITSKKIKFERKSVNWEITVLRVLRSDNSEIIKLGFDSTIKKDNNT